MSSQVSEKSDRDRPLHAQPSAPEGKRLGARIVIGQLLANGIDTFFTNPGTSELGLVNAIADNAKARGVPVLHESIAAGAADGFYRCSGRPAATLLHVGPGLANAWSSLHNAAKAGSGILNIVGQPSNEHLRFESPLRSDLVGLAKTVSKSVNAPETVGNLEEAVANASAAAIDGAVSTLVLPNDLMWSRGHTTEPRTHVGTLLEDSSPNPLAVRGLARGERTLLLLGGKALTARCQILAGAIAKTTGCKVLLEWANTRCDRGGGLPRFERIPYSVDDAVLALEGFDTIVTCGAKPPVAFFNYPGKPSLLFAEGTRILKLAPEGIDPVAVVEETSKMLGTRPRKHGIAFSRSKKKQTFVKDQAIDVGSAGTIIASHIPEGGIVVDEAITSGAGIFEEAGTAPRHWWIDNLGGAIGFAVPVAIGAAISSPSRSVVALCGDGSAMYTVQGLWTIAREKLNVTVIVYANRAYRILNESMRQIVGCDELAIDAHRLLSLANPDIDWVLLGRALGMNAERAKTCDELESALSAAFATPSPQLIEIVL